MQSVSTVLARMGHGDRVSVQNRWLRRLRRAAMGLVCCVGLLPLSAKAQITFTRVADNSTLAPDGTLFTGQFTISPAIDGTNVVFSAGTQSYRYSVTANVNNDKGVYRWDGHTLTTVADANTPLPDASDQTMAGMSFNSVAISGTEVAFSTRSTSNSLQAGVFATFNGELKALATTGTPVPGGTGTFTSVGRVTRSGDNVAFANTQVQSCSGVWGRDLQYKATGIYLSNATGPITTVVDGKTTVPGTTPGPTQKFTELYDSIDIDGRSVAFVGEWGLAYVANASGITSVGSRLMQGGVSLDGSNVAFGDNVVMALLDGKRRVLVEYGTEYDSWVFGLIDRNPSIDGGTVVFGANARGAEPYGFDLSQMGGIYMWRDGVVSKIINVNDTLDGKALAYLHTGPDSLSGDNIVFHAGFRDGTEGIYVASLPEPTSAMLLAGAIATLGFRRRSCFA
ncbi:MAG: hypothetical protein ACM359_07445 [Bacillota bacterium]